MRSSTRGAAIGVIVMITVTMRSSRAEDAAPPSAGARVLLTVDGERSLVKSFDDGGPRGQATLGVDLEELTGAQLNLIDQLVDGVVAPHLFALEGPNGKQKGSAKLLSIKLPPIGVGGNGISHLVFATEKVTRSPFVLASSSSNRGSPGRRLGAVRAEIDGIAVPIVGVDAITLREKGSAPATRVDGEVGLTAPTASVSAFAKGGRATRSVLLEYLDTDQTRMLALELASCRVRGAKPSGSPTTRIALDCPSVRKASRP